MKTKTVFVQFDLEFWLNKLYLHRQLIETGSTNFYIAPFKQLITCYFFFKSVHSFLSSVSDKRKCQIGFTIRRKFDENERQKDPETLILGTDVGSCKKKKKELMFLLNNISILSSSINATVSLLGPTYTSFYLATFAWLGLEEILHFFLDDILVKCH